ncbi:MAG: hypothetical protein JSR82_02050 [Verrucomicrobia bacterium]|nr:hypothetical protein [Verrucomicrobiota bacterium]
MSRTFAPLLALLAALPLSAGQRINHEGRILGPVPAPLTSSILFNTPEADAVMAALQIFPRDNGWNERITNRPLLTGAVTSADMIAQISADLLALGSTRTQLRPFYEMNFVLVPDNQPNIPIFFNTFPTQSDLNGGVSPNGLWPIPSNLPIEGWPVETGGTLAEIQTTGSGDRHSIMIQPGNGAVWETWMARRTGSNWAAANGAKFQLDSNALRPAGWTSGDAAGASMLAGLVRYDECQRGMVEHAIRLVVARSRQSYIYPANHQAGSTTLATVPAMGQRLRLRASFSIPANWTIQAKAVARALQKYGAIVADNGNFFSISVVPDDRFPAGCFDQLRTLLVGDFEVIQTTGPTEGPRAPGAPTASVGADQVIRQGNVAALPGVVTGSGLTVAWSKASGPGTVTFTNAAAAATSATFSTPGRYVLLLSADDGTHAVAYDALTIDVLPNVTVVPGANATVQFGSAVGQNYRVDRCDDPVVGNWTVLNASVPGTGNIVQVVDAGAGAVARRFYRVVLL